jgi:hypothetical protein
MTTCQLRLKAAKVIEERGWHKGGFMGTDGSVCLVGALVLAAQPDESIVKARYYRSLVNLWADLPAVGQACKAMGFRVGEDDTAHSWPPHHWNDWHGRTVADVLARLREGCMEDPDDARGTAHE